MNFQTVFKASFLLMVAIFLLQKMAAMPEINGIFAFIPYLLFILLAYGILVNWSKISKYLGFALVFSVLASCQTVESDKIGVRVENFGKTPNDYSIVYGRFPSDWSQSSWNLKYPGQSIGVPIEGFNVYSKDGVTFWADPSVLVELIRTDEACQKYAFKFGAYKEPEQIQNAISQIVTKECLDAVRTAFNGSISDSIIFNRGKYETQIQNQLQAALTTKYGINLSQYSTVIAPPQQLQNAINDRLLAQEETKKTMASLENASAKIKLVEIDRKRMLLESEGLTPQFLKKLELEYNYNAYVLLAQNPAKVFITGTPTHFMLGDK